MLHVERVCFVFVRKDQQTKSIFKESTKVIFIHSPSGCSTIVTSYFEKCAKMYKLVHFNRTKIRKIQFFIGTKVVARLTGYLIILSHIYQKKTGKKYIYLENPVIAVLPNKAQEVDPP